MKVGFYQQKGRIVMKKFKVNIVETYKRTIEIEAESEDEAYDMVEEKIMEGEIDVPCDGGDYDYSRDLFVSETKE